MENILCVWDKILTLSFCMHSTQKNGGYRNPFVSFLRENCHRGGGCTCIIEPLRKQSGN
jgi:hypothetical protein